MRFRRLDVVVPGDLRQRTGGFIYDARMVDGLRRLGWDVEVHELDGSFPEGDGRARASLAQALAAVPDRSPVVVDGLAMGGLPDRVRDQSDRLRIVALVHHPLADETGLPTERQDELALSEAIALNACVGVIVTSAFTARRLSGFGVDRRRVRVVRPGTDPAPPARGPARGDAPCLLCLGAVVPRKGQDVLVKALLRLRSLSWRCVCAGSLERAPAFAAAVQQLVHDGDLFDRIAFPGECDESTVDRLYDAASLFVLPSHYEGYGMAFADAIARALPIIGTTGGAIPETVPADAGILVSPGDDRSLADALGALIDDTSVGGEGAVRRARLAAGAARHASRLPTWPEAVSSFADAVHDLAGPAGSDSAGAPAGRATDVR